MNDMSWISKSNNSSLVLIWAKLPGIQFKYYPFQKLLCPFCEVVGALPFIRNLTMCFVAYSGSSAKYIGADIGHTNVDSRICVISDIMLSFCLWLSNSINPLVNVRYVYWTNQGTVGFCTTSGNLVGTHSRVRTSYAWSLKLSNHEPG